MDKKFKAKPKFYEQYKNFIDEYIVLGHMTEIEEDFDPRAYYLPHHAEVRPDSLSTKLRVVFDASAKITGTTSLNSHMLAGPRLQDELSTILLRWRSYKYVLTSDVEKMFRQILISPHHRKYQRILWKEVTSAKIRTLELNTVTYGTTSAPYLAIKTLRKLDVTKRDFYVDDLLTGANTIHECIQLQSELTSMFRSAGFQLRKWSTNNSKILVNINKSDINVNHLMICDEKAVKTLGIKWNPQTDCFQFKIEPMDFENTSHTKVKLSSDIAKLFDPLGWLSPVTILDKLLLQECWCRKLNWTDKLPNDIIAKWKTFREFLCYVNNLKFPR